MKMVKKSRTPSFGSQNAGLVNQHKRLAMGSAGPVSTTKNPGTRGSRVPGMKKS